MSARVLIIEDPLGRENQLRAYLEDHNYVVTTATYWEEGFEQLSYLYTDIVIIDLPLADGKSLELYIKLKQAWALARRKFPLVIFYNRERSLSFLMKAYQAGVDFIVEPEAARPGKALLELKIVIEALLLRARKMHFAPVLAQPALTSRQPGPLV